jgi:hypothetical protein
MDDQLEFPWQQAAIVHHSQRLLRSFAHWTGRTLLEVEGTPEAIAQALFEAPFVVTSHGTEADPILNYGNRKALELWQMDWQQFTRTPSRYTAEPMEQEERARLLEQAKQQGVISNYEGIRISCQGQRFRIQNVIVWDVLDEDNICCGQAATFSSWVFLA